MLTVAEIDDGLYRVRWCANPGSPMRKGQTFRVGCASESLFVVSCDHVATGSSHRSNTLLRLRVVDTARRRRPDPADGAAEGELACANPPGCRLVDVWTRALGADSKLHLRQQAPDTWVANSSRVDVDEQRQSLVVKLWLKFERPSPAKKALKQLLALLDGQVGCDVTIQLDNGEKIGAHRAVLLARTKMVIDGEDALVKVDDVDPRVFKHFLHYVYSAEHVEPLTVPRARQLLMMAERFKMGDLKEECANFMLSHIDVGNAVDLLSWAHERSSPQLEEACAAFVVRNGAEIVTQDGFERLMKERPDVCLRITRQMLAKKMERRPSDTLGAPVDERDELEESDTSESAIESDCHFNYF